MKHCLGPENTDADDLIPPREPDGSGIGVNYADAYLRAFAGELDDGRKTSCKRKGLKITLTVGDQSGEALLRRLEHGPDAKDILRRALESAASDAGFDFSVDAGQLYLEETAGS